MLLCWRVGALTVLMSAAVQPWTQISLHAVKSDPRHVCTPLPLVQCPRQKTAERPVISHQCKKNRMTTLQRLPLIAIRLADNDFFWLEGWLQSREIRPLSELIHAGSSFRIKKVRENGWWWNRLLRGPKRGLGAESGRGRLGSFSAPERRGKKRWDSPSQYLFSE